MNEVADIFIFLGRFHPLIVHLPIGFIMFAFLLELLSKWKNLKELRAAIPFALIFSFLSAVVACTLGYMLSMTGEYDGPMLDGHFWFGIATTIITLVAWLISIEKIKINALQGFKANISTLTLLVVLISITGHYGGNLTHGSEYLTEYAPFGEKPKEKVKPKSIEEVAMFEHIVLPILEEKCTSCHNPSKKKGGLALHDMESILKGGKEGLAVAPGDVENSELIHRVTMNPHDKGFMPPEGKTPLTEEEIKLISFWIASNKTDFNFKLAESPNKDEVLKIALAYLHLEGGAADKMPTVQPVDSLYIGELIGKGFTIRELVYNANLFDVVLPENTAKTSEEAQKLLEDLSKIKNNILWLSLEKNNLTDQHLTTLASFNNLRQLKLNKNNISNNGVKSLQSLPNLKALGLYGTAVDDECLTTLSAFKKLEKVYLWQTKVSPEKIKTFRSKNPKPALVAGINN
ncbi:c-type cytochrome domain-containing protein [Ochrovirga pacifica]|uniref:c-type cytochrome domain-containing protein n=1 Tax=Ochrovirga pacifica TaxID=1042376 RepID=UPI000255777C|nr:c-type cytochrome domain-containing protein [Ochrovirga pacifica]